ncbi:hypothetical protein GA0116948_1257 [Chitinophaga costaii]|uniref:Uncharacterized protein n=1 Tax=Chitinophaga costaii TaxID=1335309 RepID=A0A1C4G6H5_9BACT|nr:hypothetical protein [Chitinophaga costaii]PUZ19596.1 hypothetical protein DCM91_20395 [Chitinophaga costaii]SCC63799.1 hypothetical protein GA0116948_1257 [Chitinophaga costaii]
MLSDPLSQQKLVKIFSNKKDRELFISNYDFSATDENNLFYKNYIDNNCLSLETDILILILDLSVSIEYFKDILVHHTWSLYKKKRFLFRLTFLDYLCFFQRKIDTAIYLEMNESVLKTSSNIALAFQAAINLYDWDKKYMPYVFKFLKKASSNSNYYIFFRIVQFLEQEEKDDFNLKVKDHVKMLLSDKDLILPGNHKFDLLKRVNDIK